jgi:uncharacterized repeat protein (TIGR03803 family)
MKTRLWATGFHFLALCAGVQLHAQTLTTLVSFNGTNGEYPSAGLTLGNDGNFYGTTYTGGNTNLNSPNGCGTVFKITTNGTLTTLVSFSITNGFAPAQALIIAGNTLYGTTYYGGNAGVGTIFAVNTDGSSFTNLYDFGIQNNLVYPNGLILSKACFQNRFLSQSRMAAS